VSIGAAIARVIADGDVVDDFHAATGRTVENGHGRGDDVVFLAGRQPPKVTLLDMGQNQQLDQRERRGPARSGNHHGNLFGEFHRG
jgi:hypothetical protein